MMPLGLARPHRAAEAPPAPSRQVPASRRCCRHFLAPYGSIATIALLVGWCTPPCRAGALSVPTCTFGCSLPFVFSSSLLHRRSLTAGVVSRGRASSVVVTSAARSPARIRANLSFRGGSSSWLSSLGQSSSSKEKSDGDVQKKEPRTGWGHNQPGPSSSFWTSGTNEGRKLSETGSRSTDKEGAEDEPRTGWLHNTKPKTPPSRPAEGESPARRLLRLERAKKMTHHRILDPPVFHPCGGGRRAVVTEHKISVAVSRTRGKESEDRIDVFFSVVSLIEQDGDESFYASLTSESPTKRAELYTQHFQSKNADDMILYLQGGPGFGAPAPVVGLSFAEKGSWAGEAFGKGFKRIVLMDQRGTGRSTPITKQTLERRFPDLFVLDELEEETESADNGRVVNFGSVAEQLDLWGGDHPDLAARVGVSLGQAAEYMSNFRADNIVRDAEDVKDALLLPPDGEDEARPWGAALGQSFGGFCMMTYLSQVSYPPKICLLTGGIAPMLTPAYDAYESLWDRVRERNLRYYERYPGDVGLVKRIVRRLTEEPAILPSGGKLTARRFLQLGLGLGGSPSAFASLHALLSSAIFNEGNDEDDGDWCELSRAFLKSVDASQSFDDHPIYFLLHESIYADGSSNSPTDWSAHRAYVDRTKTPSEFSYGLTSKLNSDARPTMFFGEMVFPWMADGDFAELSGFGMRSLAQSLASKDDWGPLYDAERMRAALAEGGPSRAAAAVYYDDMYVDFDASMAVARRGAPLERCKVWVTNEYQHSGLRDDGAAVFSKLLGMAKGSIGTPS